MSSMSEESNNCDTPNCDTFRSPGTSWPSVGWTATTFTSGLRLRRNLLVPLTVPQVPNETNRCVTWPLVCRQISGPVVRKWASTFFSFSYWLGMAYLWLDALACVLARLIEPSPRPGAGHTS